MTARVVWGDDSLHAVDTVLVVDELCGVGVERAARAVEPLWWLGLPPLVAGVRAEVGRGGSLHRGCACCFGLQGRRGRRLNQSN